MKKRRNCEKNRDNNCLIGHEHLLTKQVVKKENPVKNIDVDQVSCVE